MKKRIILICLGMLVLLAGCQASRPQFTKTDDNSTVSLKAGEEFSVALEGNPTTGYAWALDDANSSGVEQIGEPDYTSDSSAIGSGGRYVFTFKATQSGEHVLRLKYWRSFEPDTPPVETFTLSLRVE